MSLFKFKFDIFSDKARILWVRNKINDENKTFLDAIAGDGNFTERWQRGLSNFFFSV